MKIAVIGAGKVGQALGLAMAGKNHQVAFGVRDIADPKHAALAGQTNVSLRPVLKAASEAEVILLSTPWAQAITALAECGPLNTKIVVDCTNPIKPDFSGLIAFPEGSAAQAIAARFPGARVVKCFNQTGVENMQNPLLDGHRVVMIAAGDDVEAVKTVASLSIDIGFQTLTLGGLALARELEHFAWLWITLALKQGHGRHIGFSVLQR